MREELELQWFVEISLIFIFRFGVSLNKPIFSLMFFKFLVIYCGVALDCSFGDSCLSIVIHVENKQNVDDQSNTLSISPQHVSHDPPHVFTSPPNFLAFHRALAPGPFVPSFEPPQ